MSGANPAYDIAVVGCGPVGAMAANLFGHAGLRTLAIEREAAPYPLPRAVHIDHEMMRIFQSAGLADAVLPLMSTRAQCAPPSVLRYIAPRCPAASSVPSASAAPVQKEPL